jgi:hypothetical protein
MFVSPEKVALTGSVSMQSASLFLQVGKKRCHIVIRKRCVVPTIGTLGS